MSETEEISTSAPVAASEPEKPVPPVVFRSTGKLPALTLPGTRPLPPEPPDDAVPPVVSRPVHDALRAR